MSKTNYSSQSQQSPTLIQKEKQQQSIILCFWCRTTTIDKDFRKKKLVVSCPIDYICRQIKSMYTTSAGHDSFSIQECCQKDAKLESSGKIIERKPFYKTTGQFCSYECCLAFINNELKNPSNRPLVFRSKTLLYKILKESNIGIDFNVVTIKEAPHFSLMKPFGGHLKKTSEHSNGWLFDVEIDHVPFHEVFFNRYSVSLEI
jgi:hypothetical protein